MQNHKVRVYPSKEHLAKENQLAWKIAEVAADPVAVEPAVTDMVINRMIDNASVAIAAINRTPVGNARSQALCHPRQGGATAQKHRFQILTKYRWTTKGRSRRRRSLNDLCC